MYQLFQASAMVDAYIAEVGFGPASDEYGEFYTNDEMAR